MSRIDGCTFSRALFRAFAGACFPALFPGCKFSALNAKYMRSALCVGKRRCIAFAAQPCADCAFSRDICWVRVSSRFYIFTPVAYVTRSCMTATYISRYFRPAFLTFNPCIYVFCACLC